MVNRLRPLLNELISPHQSAFILGRLITDNAIIAFECLHAIQQGTIERNNLCAYKLDLSKAYDRVDWGFLEKVLSSLSFQSSWVQWVMSCVTTVRYSVCLNGVPWNPSNHPADYAKVIHFRHICSFLSLMPFPLLYKKMCRTILLKSSKSRGKHLVFHTSYLQMMLYFFSELMLSNQVGSEISYQYLRKVQAKS